jgi:hypothetical protein
MKRPCNIVALWFAVQLAIVLMTAVSLIQPWMH